MAEELGDQRLQGWVLTWDGFHHLHYLNVQAAVDSALRGAELLRSSDDSWTLADSLWVAGLSLTLQGRLNEAAEIGREAEPLANRLGHMGALVLSRRGRGFADLMLSGDIESFGAFGERDLEMCSASGFPWISNSHTFVGMAHFFRGEWGRAAESFDGAVKLEPLGFMAGADWAFVLLCSAYSGDRRSTLAMLHRNPILVPLLQVVRRILLRRPKWLPSILRYLARRRLRPGQLLRMLKLSHIGELPGPGQTNTWGAWIMLLAAVQGLAIVGERQKVARLYPVVLQGISTGAVTPWAIGGLFQTAAGIAAHAGRRWDKADEHFQAALVQADEIPHKVEQPEVRRWYAKMLIDQGGPGDPDKARELLTEAIAMYRKMGMPKHVEMTEAMLGDV